MSGWFHSDKSEYQKRKANGSLKVTDEEPEGEEEEEEEEEVDTTEAMKAYVKENFAMGRTFAVLTTTDWNYDDEGEFDAAIFDHIYETYRCAPLMCIPDVDGDFNEIVFRKEA